MKFFISYCDNGGLQFAADAAFILENNGHQAWYFDRDKTSGILRIVDITEHIRNWCNKVLYICTNRSIHSDGQSKEIGQWDNTNKQLIVIPIDVAVVPITIDPYIHNGMSGHRFKDEFNRFVTYDLERKMERWEELHRIIEVRST